MGCRIVAKKFGEVVVELGFAKKVDIEAALRVQKQKRMNLGEILTSYKVLTHEQVAQVLEHIGYERVNVNEYNINKSLFDDYHVDIDLLINNSTIPIELKDGILYIATNNPLNFPLFDQLKECYEAFNTEVYVDNKDAIDVKLKELFPTYAGDIIESVVVEDSEELEDDVLIEDVNVSDSPLVRKIDYIIYEAIKLGASDIHIEPQENSDTRVRLRLDGDLVEFTTIARKWKNHAVARVKILGKMDISKKREPQDGEFSFSFQGATFNIRVSTVPSIHGEKVVLRILGSSGQVINIEELGFLDNYEKVINKISKKQGIIVVTGPTGSGKTTTLASILKVRNKPNVNIMTIENPAEIRIKGITQVEASKNMDFAQILRAFLRQDPDIIMVGEVRDKESASIAVGASLTGHLLLTTMHTNNAIGVVTRLVDMGVEPYLVADALELVISQRLVKKICPYCKEPDEEGLASARKLYSDIFENVDILYKGKGCPKCNNRGFLSRLPVFEVLALDDNLRRLIAKGDLEAIKDTGAVKHIIYDGMEKAKLGLTTFKEVYENLYFA